MHRHPRRSHHHRHCFTLKIIVRPLPSGSPLNSGMEQWWRWQLAGLFFGFFFFFFVFLKIKRVKMRV
jgi:drug/metabolite transporter (DMT)-like permease